MNSRVIDSNDSALYGIGPRNILRDSTNKADSSQGASEEPIVVNKIKANNGSHSLSSFNEYENSEELKIQTNRNAPSQVTFNEMTKSHQESQSQEPGKGPNFVILNESVTPNLEPQALESRKQSKLLLMPNPKDLEPILGSENQDPDIDIKRSIREGNKKLLLGDYEQAKKEYEKVLEAKPDCFEGLCNCGIVWYCLKDKKKALKCFKRALKIQSDSTIHLLVAQIYEKFKNLKKATMNYKKASGEDKLNNDVKRNADLVLEGLKHNKMTPSNYKKTTDEDPFKGAAFIFYGNFLIEHRYNGHQSIAKYRKAIRAAFPTEVPSSIDLGWAKEWENPELSNGIGLDEEVSGISEQNENSDVKLQTAAGHNSLLNMSPEAVDVAVVALLNMAQVSVRNNFKGWPKKNLADWARKDFMGWAFKEYEKVIVNFGNNDKYKKAAYAGLAKWYTAQKKYDEAVEMYSKVFPTHTPSSKKEITKVDNMTDVKENRYLAKLEAKKGDDFIRKKDYDAAEEAYEKSYELFKNGYLENFNLAKINIIHGRKEEAAKFLKRADNILPSACIKLELRTVPISCQLKTL